MVMSQLMHNLSEEHMDAMNGILQYLKSSQQEGVDVL